MTKFKKHDFSFFGSEKELQEALARRTASIVFKTVNEGLSIDEFLRTSLTLLLIDAVSIGIRPTFLVKDRLEMLFEDDAENLISLLKGAKIEGFSTEEILEMWKEELKGFEGMTEQEIYDVLSKS